MLPAHFHDVDGDLFWSQGRESFSFVKNSDSDLCNIVLYSYFDRFFSYFALLYLPGLLILLQVV